MNESELIQGCIKSDIIAQRELFDKYSAVLMTVCRRYALHQQEAEDMLQDSFINIFKHIRQFNSTGSFEGWLKRITVNSALKVLQKRKMVFTTIASSEFELESPEAGILSDLNAEDLLKLISQLPDGYRTIFNLYVLEGYSHEEIAGMLKIKTATSRSQLKKARVLLQSKIDLLQKIPD